MQSILAIEDPQPHNAVFLLAGYESTNFVIESAALVFAIIGFLLVTLARLGAKRLSTRCRNDNRIRRYLHKPENILA